jgi:putative ABC transport system permease protein
VSEVALAVMLLVGAGLTVRSLQKLLTIDPGFTAEQAVSMRITLPDTSYPDEQRWAQFYRELLARVTPLAGFDAVGLNSLLPLTESSSESEVVAEGKPLPSPEEHGRMCLFQTASGGYFKAMGITVLSGRTFDDRDRAETTKVVLVDETLASALWPGESAVGKRLAFEFGGHYPENVIPMWREVVGVVRHVKHYGLTRSSFVQIYAPIEQSPFWNEGRRPGMALVVRSRLAPESVVGLVRREVAALDAELPVYDVRTMPEYVARQVEQPRFSMILLSVFGGLALVLAVVGIYGVLSYSVSQRTQEIGIRMAIGARASDVLLLVFRQGVGMALVGLAVGVAGALAVRQVLQSILVGVSPTDPLTFGSVIGIIVVSACVAAYLPARRATRVDPIEVLRAE